MNQLFLHYLCIRSWSKSMSFHLQEPITVMLSARVSHRQTLHATPHYKEIILYAEFLNYIILLLKLIITRPWLEFKQESKIVYLKFQTPAHIWNICSIKFSLAVSRRQDIVNKQSEKLQSLHILHETTLLLQHQIIHFGTMKQEAQLHLALTYPCFSICHSSPMQFSIMERQYLSSWNIWTGTALKN